MSQRLFELLAPYLHRAGYRVDIGDDDAPSDVPPSPSQRTLAASPHTDVADLYHLRCGSTLPPTSYPLFPHFRHKASNLLPSLHQLAPSPRFSSLDRHLASAFIPDWQRSLTHFDTRAFCCAFSKDGRSYMVATQDHTVHLYHTHSPSPPRPFKQIRAHHVGWSIIDLDYSPDSRFVCYSTWSRYIHLCNVDGEYELHEPLDMQTSAGRVCFFSTRFSPDGRHLLGGTNENRLYLFDIERRQRQLCIHGHEDDINSVAFADASGDIMLTGSDDRTIRIWDRRTLGSSAVSADAPGHPQHHQMAVGSFCGHGQGITHVEAAGDGRLFCSNGKDQCIKLWDWRRMTTAAQAVDVGRDTRAFNYQYRQHPLPTNTATAAVDCSLATYREHQVYETLIRCHFSPPSTGQRYIYTGSYGGDMNGGEVVVYDVLTGEVVRRLRGHTNTVRDVSWHPTEPILISASWDHSLGRWEFGEEDEDGDCTAAQRGQGGDEEKKEGEGGEEEEGEEEGDEGDAFGRRVRNQRFAGGVRMQRYIAGLGRAGRPRAMEDIR